MLKLLTGANGSGKTNKIYSEISNRALLGEKNLFLLVPEQYSHEAERALCIAGGPGICLHAEVVSFTGLCRRVLSDTGGAFDRYIDKAGKTLVMYRALSMAETQPGFVGKLSKKADFIRALVDTASECRSSCIQPVDLLSASEQSSPILREKLQSTAFIIELYYGIMKQDLSDPDEIPDAVLQKLDKCTFIENATFWVDGFRNFTAQELRILERIMLLGANVTISLPYDSDDTRLPVFISASRTGEILRSFALQNRIPYECNNYKISEIKPIFSHMALSVFSGSFEKKVFNNMPITAHVCRSVQEEFEAAAAEICRLVRSGVRYKDIAVAIGGFEKYYVFCESIFKKYGIPIDCTSPDSILQVPPIVAILSAFRVLLSGWEYTHMFSYLKTGFANISREECDILENYCITWGIRGNDWYKDDDWLRSPLGYREENNQELLDQINSIRRKASVPLIHFQNLLEHSESFGDKLRAMSEFLDEIHLYENMQISSFHLRNNGDLRKAAIIEETAEVLTASFEQFMLIGEEINGTLEDFAYQWQLILSQYKIGMIPSYLDRVMIGSIERIRSRGIRHLFVLGMTENEVPGSVQRNGIFSETEREKLRLIKLNLGQSEMDLLFNRLASVYDLFSQPEDSLWISYSVSENGNNPQPSRYYRALCELCSVVPKIPSLNSCRMEARVPLLSLAVSGKGPEAEAAKRYFRVEDDYIKRIKIITDAKKLSHVQISPDIVTSLYGNRISLTTTRMDLLRTCRLQYYTKYGLNAEKREEARFDAALYGTFVHEIMEKTLRQVENEGGLTKVSNERCEALARQYAEDFENQVLKPSEQNDRFRYLFHLKTESAVNVVLYTVEELRYSLFRPIDFELKFGSGGDIPSLTRSVNGTTYSAKGTIDRIDGYENDGKLYLRVIDYKTGNKIFSLSEIYHGLDLQLLLYLFSLEEFGSKKYQKEVIPAGAFYTPVKETYISTEHGISDEKIEKERNKNNKRSGILLNEESILTAMDFSESHSYLPDSDCFVNRHQIQLLKSHILKEMDLSCNLLSGGDITPTETKHNGKNTCRLCSYADICPKEYKKTIIIKNEPVDSIWKTLEMEADENGSN